MSTPVEPGTYQGGPSYQGDAGYQGSTPYQGSTAYQGGPSYQGGSSSFQGGAAQGDTSGERSLGELVSEITTDLSTLVSQEIALAKAEAKQSATRVGKGAGFLSGAGIAGHFVLLFLSIALWWLLAFPTNQFWSALMVAGLWAIAAAVLVGMGKKELAAVQGLPKTTDTVKKIPDALKGNEGATR